MRTLVMVGIAAAVIIAISILLFFQYKDPMLLVFGVVLSGMLATVVGIVHVMRRGIPVRVVGDERKER